MTTSLSEVDASASVNTTTTTVKARKTRAAAAATEKKPRAAAAAEKKSRPSTRVVPSATLPASGGIESRLNAGTDTGVEVEANAQQHPPVAAKTKAVYDITCSDLIMSPKIEEDETVIIKLNVGGVNGISGINGLPSSADVMPDEGPLAYNGFHGSTFTSDFMEPNLLLANQLDAGFQHQQQHQQQQLNSSASQAASTAAATATSAAVSAAAQPNESGGMKAIRLLMDFEEKCKNGEWPASTSIHCYWCCHAFSNTPVGIPLAYDEDQKKFMVYGCFCSCECAAAFNLDSRESSDELMMRHSLLNYMARDLGYTGIVRPAPSRLVLNIFGGPMTIETFRIHCQTARNLVLVNFPPMATVTQQVEEINQQDLRSEYRYIPIDTERVNKYKEKIKLKRTKPLVNYKNTLDHAMNLKYSND